MNNTGNHQKVRSRRLGLVAIAVAATLQNAHATDIPANAAIAKVEVFQRGASITRSNTVAIPAGQHRIVFEGLPSWVDPSLIRVTVNSKSVRLGSVDVERVSETDFVAAKERELRAEMEKLGDAKSALDDDIRVAESQLKLLDTVTFNQASQTQKTTLDVQTLQGTVATIASSGASARTRIREANIRKRELDRTIAKLNQDLQKVGTARKGHTIVRASIEASSAVTAPVTVSYNVDDAGWNWIYEAHLDTAAKKVALLKQAQIRQGSGEDWSNVDLLLTSSLPARNNQIASLLPLYVRSEVQGTAHARLLSNQQVGAMAPVASGFADKAVQTDLQEIVVTGAQLKYRRARREPAEETSENLGSYVEMDTTATEFAEAYAVPGKVSIESNRQPRMFPVTDDDFGVDLIARTVPRREAKAYLEATFKYERNVPLQSGELQLFRDEAFIGKAATGTLLPGADVRLPFGVDDRIKVAVRQEQEQSGKRGGLSRQQIKDERLRFEVTNHHSYAVKVEVLDRIPIAKSNDIRIEVPSGSTPPTQKDFENKPGLMLWKLDVDPRQTANVRHYLEIRYPNDKELAGYESAL